MVVDPWPNRHGMVMRRLVHSLGLISAATLLAIGMAGAAHGASAAATATCTNGVQIDSFTFTPPSVPAGQLSTATLVVESCTGASQPDSTMWYGRFMSSGTGIPAGCPVFDPLILPTNIPASGTASSSLGFLVPTSCTATSLQVTATVRSAAGVTLVTATASLAIAAGSSCAVTYGVNAQWPGGFQAGVTIRNTGPTAIVGWVLRFNFADGQHLTRAFNVGSATQDGTTVTLTNIFYNSTIAPGASVQLGIQGTWAGTNTAPTAFTVNGTACTT
jgi:hypothetical protein